MPAMLNTAQVSNRFSFLWTVNRTDSDLFGVSDRGKMQLGAGNPPPQNTSPDTHYLGFCSLLGTESVTGSTY